jgi:chaperonin GroEL
VLDVVAVKAPGFGDRRKALLEDVAVLTGGKVISQAIGKSLQELGLSDVGQARRIVVTHEDTTIVEGGGTPAELEARIQQIKAELEGTTSDYERDQLCQRLATLSGGVAVIHVGAATEVELKKKKARVEDALHATRAANDEGIVPGGGIVLLRAASVIDHLPLEGDQKVGASIVKRALEEPLRQLVANAGLESGVVVERVRQHPSPSWGFDVLREEYCDLLQAGIIDPAKVTRGALENAASIAGMILTTDTLVADVPDTNGGLANPDWSTRARPRAPTSRGDRRVFMTRSRADVAREAPRASRAATTPRGRPAQLHGSRCDAMAAPGITFDIAS